MKKLIFIFCFTGIVFSGFSQVSEKSSGMQILNISAKGTELKNNSGVNFSATQENQELNQSVTAIPGYVTTAANASVNTLPIGQGKYYALIIGINNYKDPLINELDYCIRDAQVFYNTITARYTFNPENVTFLSNAKYVDMINALDHFVKIVRPIDNFLIFYAGHGYWNAESETGFWLPNDAQKNSTLNWFRNSVLRDYLREISSKHTLLITDACFGGSIFKTRSAFSDANIAINKLYDLPSRKAMTSGTLTEVPDQSSFLKYLIDRLENNNEKYLASEQLFSSFRIAVINNSNAVPQFGEIRDVGDEGGDFIFILK